jgi:tRNA A37 threonylcarbamoyladenosine dehydratase
MSVVHEQGPRVFAASEQPALLSTLRASCLVSDTIRDQLGELLETRSPHRKLPAAELAAETDRLLADGADAYGSWVHFPWSKRLVHVLPRAEYVEVRTSRNKNKITLPEQQRLMSVTLGVAGLSVGQATAVTLALEGLGGTLRLADFDVLSLSNMNRLRAAVHEIGVNKAVITARTIWEFNPYARIELFEDGIVDSNIARFMDGLDLLFEECDDLKMKVLLREEARRRRIPVLMETSDRGLFDVERFDLEPTRPLFHGLAGELRADQLAGLTTYQKVPVVLSIIGADTMSPRLAGSLVDVDTSLKTWPQLASAVALGGAINTDAARRILLGQFHQSGRYFVDLEQLVSDGAQREQREAQRHEDSPVHTLAPSGAAHGARPVTITRTEPMSLEGALTRAQLEQVVSFAALAPSGGNAQPWRFVYRSADSALECWLVPERARTFLDFERRASHLAFGAAAENIRLAGVRLGLDVSIDVLPDPGRPELICVAHLRRGEGHPGALDMLLADTVETRVTNRRLGERVAMPAALERDLGHLLTGSSCSLQWLTEPAALDAFGELHGESERLRMLHPVMHPELMGELRWSPEETERTRDGIDLATLELTPTDRAGMGVLQRNDVIDVMRRIDAGQGLRQASKKALACASAVGLISSEGSSPAHYVAAGSRLQQLWLLANARGFALQPLTAMLYVFERIDQGTGDFSERELLAFERTRAALRSLFPAQLGHTPMFAFRLARAPAPTARSLRRSVSQLLELR